MDVLMRIIQFEIGKYLGTERMGTITFERDGRRMRNESDFFNQLREMLKAKGMEFDVIKKKAAADGHLVDDHMYLVRSRNLNDNGFVIYDHMHNLQLTHQPYNREGKVQLTIQYWAGRSKHARPLRSLVPRKEEHQPDQAPVH